MNTIDAESVSHYFTNAMSAPSPAGDANADILSPLHQLLQFPEQLAQFGMILNGIKNLTPQVLGELAKITPEQWKKVIDLGQSNPDIAAKAKDCFAQGDVSAASEDPVQKSVLDFFDQAGIGLAATALAIGGAALVVAVVGFYLACVGLGVAVGLALAGAEPIAILAAVIALIAFIVAAIALAIAVAGLGIGIAALIFAILPGEYRKRKKLATCQISLQAHNGQYVCAESGGGGQLYANRNAVDGWETFGLVDNGDGTCSLQAANLQIVSAAGGGGGIVTVDREAIGPWESFVLVQDQGKVAFRTSNGHFLRADFGGGAGVTAFDNWVLDPQKFTMTVLSGIPSRAVLPGTPSLGGAGMSIFFDMTTDALATSASAPALAMMLGQFVASGAFSTTRNHSEVYCGSPEGFLHFVYRRDGAWANDGASFLAGGKVTGVLSAVYSEQRGHSEVYLRGEDGFLHYYTVNEEVTAWLHDGPSFFQGGRVAGPVAAVYSLARNHSEVYFRGEDGLLHFFFMNNGAWAHDGQSFGQGGKVAGALAAAYSQARNHSEVYFRGEDGYLHFFYVKDGAWVHDSAWFQQGGKVVGDISAVYSPARNHSEVYFRGEDGFLHCFYVKDGAWVHDGESFRQGGQVMGPVAAVYSPARQHAEIYFRGEDGVLHFFYMNDGAWAHDGASFQAAGRVAGPISAVYSPARNHSEVYFRGEDGRLNFFRVSDGNWGLEQIF